MSKLLSFIKEQALKGNSLTESDDSPGGMHHETEFWRHIDAHMNAFDQGDHEEAQDHLKIAQLHAKRHYKNTGEKIDVSGSLDGFESRYVTHG
jgi:hypothetical protein